MTNFFFLIMLGSMLGVVAALIAGLVVMSKGGEMNKKYGNRLMQVRIMLQGAALVFFILAVMTSKGG